ncbi:hypothetical protein QIA25_06450 (plasmid) [Borreliella spielmanii]
MNKNMKMFIICAVFALIISCKNYVNSKALETSEQNVKGKVEEFLDTKKEELIGGLKKLGREVSSKVKEELMQAEEQVAQGVSEDSKAKEEIEEKIKGLKEKIDKSDDKTPLGKYSEYEEEVKKIREELEKTLKDKKEEKEKLESELETLEKTLKEKIEKRKKALEEAKQKFEEYKKQVESATGVTHGQQVKGQGQVGQQALKSANELGFKNMTSSSSSDTSNMTKEIIENALKKIEEELQKVEVKKE